jgi:transposase InsO family protein
MYWTSTSHAFLPRCACEGIDKSQAELYNFGHNVMPHNRCSLTVLGDQLLQWERTYNAIRPHQSLGYLTPLKFLEQWKEDQQKEGGVTNVLDEYTW